MEIERTVKEELKKDFEDHYECEYTDDKFEDAVYREYYTYELGQCVAGDRDFDEVSESLSDYENFIPGEKELLCTGGDHPFIITDWL